MSDREEDVEVIDLSIDTDTTEGEDHKHYKLKAVVLGEVQPKPSPRFKHIFLGYGKTKLKNGKAKPLFKSHCYNEKKTEMKAFAETCYGQFATQEKEFLWPGAGEENLPYFRGPVSIKIWFCKKPPLVCFHQGDRERPRTRLWMGKDGGPWAITKVMKPDTDNCVKFVLDAMKGYAWKDDDQVCQIEAYKCYDTIRPYEGRTIIEISDEVSVPLFPQWAIVHHQLDHNSPADHFREVADYDW